MPQSINIDFNQNQGHELISHREGEWIIFTCPKCKGFEKRYNWKTRELITNGEGGNFMIHVGSHAPVMASEKLIQN